MRDFPRLLSARHQNASDAFEALAIRTSCRHEDQLQLDVESVVGESYHNVMSHPNISLTMLVWSTQSGSKVGASHTTLLQIDIHPCQPVSASQYAAPSQDPLLLCLPNYRRRKEARDLPVLTGSSLIILCLYPSRKAISRSHFFPHASGSSPSFIKYGPQPVPEQKAHNLQFCSAPSFPVYSLW